MKMRTKDKLISNWKDLSDQIEIKTEKPDSIVEEIILCDSGDETFEDEVQVLTEIGEKLDEETKKNSQLNIKYLLKNDFLRGLLPQESDQSYYSALKVPVIKRCCIEHCYFIRNRPRPLRYNLRRSLANTLSFENECSNEQQTIDLETLTSQEVNSVSVNDSLEQNNVNCRKKKNSVSSSSSVDESLADDSNDQDYRPEENITDSENASDGSKESCDSVKEVWKSDSNNKNVDDRRKPSTRRIGISSYPTVKTPNDFVSVHDLLNKIRNMQKLMKAKNEKKFSREHSGKGGKIHPSRLKGMSREEDEDFPKFSDYMFPIPNLTKMINGDKNWRMEYMNDEVQSLGLDDLLLKASELNAENFTKALGRKLDSSKANFKEGSEIVFTIPKEKRNSIDEEENRGSDSEFTKSSKSSKVLSTSKADKVNEIEPSGETPKLPDEAPPKRLGIKVKTVENINEEFKDSLGLKNKIFQDCKLDKEISLLESRNTFGGSTNLEKESKTQEEFQNKDEGMTPFTMTIIQSKTEKQRPAILRNSSYFKKKASQISKKVVEKPPATSKEENIPSESITTSAVEETTPVDSLSSKSQSVKKGSFNSFNVNNDNFNGKSFAYSKVLEETEGETLKTQDGGGDSRFAMKKRNIPFILNHNRKIRQSELPPSVGSPITNSANNPQISLPSKLVKVSEGSEKVPMEKTFKVMSIEQKLGPKESSRRFIKMVPYEPAHKFQKKVEVAKGSDTSQKLSDDESTSKSAPKDGKGNNILSLTAFASVLKDILPDKWFLCLDKKYGLQIIKTHLDEFFNPSILISMVIARCGKLTVNVRGKQLKKSHELFSNLCDMTNSENKLSLNYVLAILNKLRGLSVCYGCDDPSLKNYWCGNGFLEYHTEYQQVYRSHLCHLLVSLGKKRCYPCYRMNESFKKRFRRDKLGEKAKEDPVKDSTEKETTEVEESSNNPKARGVKRNLEDFLEESFSTMKKQISDEIAKNKKMGERESALKAQEEVLSFMGLTRKDNLDNPVRKSKRKKNSFYKLQQPGKKKIDQQELEFLEKYWPDINTLFSTSLLFGAYSRTGRGRLREKCRMFQKLLSTWKNIVRSNPDWIGGEISLPGELTDGDSPEKDSESVDQFEKMDVSALRAYIINSVKEVNRIKHKLRTRNSYFKILYNKFVKRRMKRPKQLISPSEKKGNGSSANSTTNTPTPTDFSSDESSRDKGKTTDDENRPANDLVMSCVSDGDEQTLMVSSDREKCK